MKFVVNVGRNHRSVEEDELLTELLIGCVKQSIADKLEGFNIDYITLKVNDDYHIVESEEIITDEFNVTTKLSDSEETNNYLVILETFNKSVSGSIDLLLSKLIGLEEDFIILMEIVLIDRCAYFLELDVIKDK